MRASEAPRVPVSDPGTTIRDICVSIRQRHSFHSKNDGSRFLLPLYGATLKKAGSTGWFYLRQCHTGMG